MKRTLSLFLALLLFLGSSLLLSGCNSSRLERFSVQRFELFDTVTTVTGYAEDRAAFDAVASGILAELEEYHRLYDIYHTYEGIQNLATVNSLVDGEHPVVKVDRRILELLQTAKILESEMQGKMNIAMGSVLSLWHTCRTEAEESPLAARIPTAEALKTAGEHTSIHALVINEAAGSVHLTDPQATLDVGAIAKGYAVECIAARLEAEGVTGYLLNVGGNVRAVGGKPDGEPWTAGVQHPDDEEEFLARVRMQTGALVTSGSYLRCYTVDGVSYHHIIDPATGMPSAYFKSVSVLAPSSALADALSTALFCMSYEEGVELLRAYPGVGVLWVSVTGEVRMNDAFSASCKK